MIAKSCNRPGTSGANIGVLFALKVFRKLSLPQRRERFLQEISFLQNCNHPSLMKVYDSGVFKSGKDEFPFVVAEYLPQQLFGIIRGNIATTVQKITFSLQLLSSLAYLDSLNPKVVHRDIKPQNIFVKGGACVLGDFGLMKLLDGTEEQDKEIFKESTGPGMPFFYPTPDLVAYAKNEKGISTKTDVFQLGLVLAELFTGRNPAKRRDDHLADVELEPLGNIPGGLSGGIATLINRMLTMSENDRPSASQLLGGWQGLFANAVDRAHALDGRALP